MVRPITPAKSYTHTDDLWIITAFYNSNAYVTKPRNFNSFIERIESARLNYTVVECAFNKQPFTFKKNRNIIQVRTEDIMWQKERLLNIALEQLPSRCKKAAWLDCDVLFENPDWAVDTVQQLKHHKVVQPFSKAIRLPKNAKIYRGQGECYPSFGAVVKKNPYLLTQGKFEDHGHTGFAWASHTSILKKYGLYDVCIAGTADHLMAHSFSGDWDTACIKRIFGNNSSFRNHYKKWSKKVFSSVKSKVGYVDGTLLHLWHGDIENRDYSAREKVLIKYNFNPSQDIKIDKNECWKWNHNNKVLKQWAKQYFVLRKED